MGLDMYLIKRKKDEKKDYWAFDNEMIYWRKANQVHNYFCCAGEEIEEQVIYKITKSVLEELLKKCNQILEVVKTNKGQVINGKTLVDGEWKPILEEGLVITNQEEIADILPTCEGFFFGSTEYDEYYLEDIKYTKEKLEEVFKQIDFENEDVYYLASW